jgi:hypothetical protein
MSQNSLCRPDGSNREDGGSASATGSQTGEDAGYGRTRRNAGQEFASAEQCLRCLTQIAGLVAIGMLTPAQGNSMGASYATILQYHQKTQSAPVHGPATADVMQALRDHPELAAVLEPLLTDEQLEALMKEARDHREGEGE